MHCVSGIFQEVFLLVSSRIAHPSRMANRPFQVPFHVPSLGIAEARAAAAIVRSGVLGGGGPRTHQVERQLQRFTGSPNVFFVTSCTHALELALMALRIRTGDEVILPSFTFPSTATCVVRQGARPVFADIDPATWHIDPQDLLRCISRKTRAIILVHYAGQPAPVQAIASRLPKSCFIIEDAAHAFGASERGRMVGFLGHAGCFSFHMSKNVTCGEGGALLLSDARIAQRAEYMREYGTNRRQFMRGEVPSYAWVSEGSSFFASDLQAGIVLEQFKKTRWIIARRRDIWHRYLKGLQPLAAEGHVTLPVLRPGVRSAYHIFAVLISRGRERIRKALARRGVDAKTHYVPLHLSPYWRRVTGGRQRRLPVTERVSATLLRLPIYPSLTRTQQQRVIEAMRDLLGS